MNAEQLEAAQCAIVWSLNPNRRYAAACAALDALAAALVAAQARVARVDAACFEVCADNTEAMLGEPPSTDCGRFVRRNENGDPLVDTDDAAEVVLSLNKRWGAATVRAEQAEARVAALEGKECQWEHMNGEPDGNYDTACGQMCSFIGGDIEENNVQFCHGCGGRVLPPTPNGDEVAP